MNLYVTLILSFLLFTGALLWLLSGHRLLSSRLMKIKVIVTLVVVFGLVVIFIVTKNRNLQYEVSVSEDADIDELEENFNIVEKEDSIWIIQEKPVNPSRVAI